MADFVIDGNKNQEAKARAEKAVGTVTIHMMPDGVDINMKNVNGKMLFDSLPCYIEAVIEDILNPEAANDVKALMTFKGLVSRAVQNGFDTVKKGVKA